ncbi:DUF3150 domain-containing protein [Desulfopila sp. IMCC35006]|uniref:DUF3150 domain-containing protein n=1 Tax=Desulfopila sp. IMCC35006 TaxID=2569542 RepID=UPI001F109DA2|nr:DUF3150 domain-containing protein [Desulfopila sp. IMCC35006]
MVINLDVNIWSARKKLSPADFGGVNLPPEELTSLGSKKICNPEDLRIFSTLKSRAVTMLDHVGVRFLSGWGIPQSMANQVVKDLQVIHDEFMAAKDTFLSSYDQSVLDWVNQHMEWKEIIENSVVSADYVSSRLGFRWQLFQLAPPQEKFIHDGLKDEVAKLGSTLYGEIARTAEDTWKKCYSGKDQVSQKALSPLRSIYEKLSGLSFVEPCAAPISNLLKIAFDQIPSKGFIKGADLLMIQGVLALLRDPVSLIEHGKSIIKGRTPESVLQLLVQPDDTQCTPTPKVIGQSETIPDNYFNQPSIDSLGLW